MVTASRLLCVNATLRDGIEVCRVGPRGRSRAIFAYDHEMVQQNSRGALALGTSVHRFRPLRKGEWARKRCSREAAPHNSLGRSPGNGINTDQR